MGVRSSPASNQAYTGISAAESMTTGLPAFRSAASIVFLAAGSPWAYEFNSKWLLQGNVEMRQLSAPLGSSPLMQVRVNSHAAVGLAHRI